MNILHYWLHKYIIIWINVFLYSRIYEIEYMTSLMWQLICEFFSPRILWCYSCHSMCDSGPRFVRCSTSTWSDKSLKTTPLTSTTTLTTSSGSWRNCVPRSETTKWPNWKPSKKLSPFLSKFCVKCTIELKDYFCRMVLYIHVNLFEAKLFIFHGDDVVRFEKIYFLIMKAL